MPNLTRKELKKTTAAMNHMRNIIYHLIKWMKNKGLNDSDINNRIRRMGKNVAKTELELFDFNTENYQSLITDIYSKLLGSKISISYDSISQRITVVDSDCPVCKYIRPDINVAPCELITSMVNTIANEKNLTISDSWVIESKSLGGTNCVHSYEIKGVDNHV